MISNEVIEINKNCLMTLQKDLNLMRECGGFEGIGAVKLRTMYNILNCKRIIDNNNSTKYFELQERIKKQLSIENDNTAYDKQCECLLKQIDIELDFLNKEITNEFTR